VLLVYLHGERRLHRDVKAQEAGWLAARWAAWQRRRALC
jgi:hypothetical protein